MLVGMMRFKDDPPMGFFTLLTMVSKYNGVELIYLSPDSFNMKKKSVRGKMLINGELITVERELPKFIDISPYFFSDKNKTKYNEITDYLVRNTELSIDKRSIIKKDALQKFLFETEELSYMAIPFEPVSEFDKFLDFLNRYNKVVIKPIGGLQGKSVVAIEKENDNYILGDQKETKIMSYKEVSEYFEKHFLKKEYIMQKFIHSRSKDDNPIDCRIHLEKNGDGEWEVARQFIRIGIGQTVVSNISQGGCISDVNGYLQSDFTDNWEEIYENILTVGKRLPYLLEDYNDKEYMTMGLDVGIDSDGTLYLFEVNSFPIVLPQRGQIARLRGEYYAYRVKKLVYRTSDEIKLLNYEKNKLKRELNDMKESNSWKFSKPIRVIGKIFKNTK